MVKVTVFVEGGRRGNRRLNSAYRQAFHTFFEKAFRTVLKQDDLRGRLPSVIPSGSGSEAFDDFSRAVKKAGLQEKTFLLVDSEGPVAAGDSTWVHIKKTLDCSRPKNADEDSAHLMVQCIESWFFADAAALARAGFQINKLKSVANVEEIPKKDALENLKGANGEKYKKSAAPDILEKLDPQKVTSASSHAARFVQALCAAAKL
jgi:hypothetical protein